MVLIRVALTGLFAGPFLRSLKRPGPTAPTFRKRWRDSRSGVAPALAIAAAGLGGCAQLTPDQGHRLEESEQVSRVDTHSSFPALRRVYFEQANLIELIDPKGRAKSPEYFQGAWNDADALGGQASGGTERYSSRERMWGIKYDLVLNWFREDSSQTLEQKRIHRNSVQDKLLAVSTSRCNVFKTYLRRQQSDVNFWLGLSTTAAGVLGAVLPGVRTSRNLAGAAGLLAGGQAEYNSAYYSNLAAQVIIQGIDLRQGKLRKELLEQRDSKSVEQYSMEAAINDAIVIDGSCSTVTGLMEAADSIKEITSPGLPTAANVIVAVRAMNELAQSDKLSDLAASGKLQQLLKQTSPMVSPLTIANLTRAASPDVEAKRLLFEASRAKAVIAQSVDDAAMGLLANFDQVQKGLADSDRANPSVRPALFASFTAAVKDKALVPKMQDCLDAVSARAQEYGSASAKAQLQASDEAARVTAEATLAKARADARAAAERVGLQVTASQQVVQTAASAWQAKFTKAKLTLADLTAISVASPPDVLNQLCPPAPAH